MPSNQDKNQPLSLLRSPTYTIHWVYTTSLVVVGISRNLIVVVGIWIRNAVIDALKCTCQLNFAINMTLDHCKTILEPFNIQQCIPQSCSAHKHGLLTNLHITKCCNQDWLSKFQLDGFQNSGDSPGFVVLHIFTISLKERPKCMFVTNVVFFMKSKTSNINMGVENVIH